ncbi:MAG: hypothetical protein E6Q97_35855 [Desulfurellales bacterium]|nr:MAG: hypothetical protein E6Q97_35855 [Desulfurellales bacterium]
MAYGNWGAYVYKNGERQTNREDNTPYQEDELQAGYWQAFGGNNEDGTRASTNSKLHCTHASLGNGPFRLCGYKSFPMIYWEGKEVDDKPYQKGTGAGTDDWNWYDSDGIEGELNGYKFKAYPSDSPEAVNLELTEPDGTKWKGKSGYCMGAGHDD